MRLTLASWRRIFAAFLFRGLSMHGNTSSRFYSANPSTGDNAHNSSKRKVPFARFNRGRRKDRGGLTEREKEGKKQTERQ